MMLFLVLCLFAFFLEAKSCETSSFKNIRATVSGTSKENPTDIILNDCVELNPETRNYFTIEVINQNIEKLNQGAFVNLPVLTLVLSNDRIGQIEKRAFKDLKTVQTVDLSKNKLTALFKDVLNDLISMKTLDLSQNELEQIEDEAFGHLVSLQELKLSFNKIKVWNPNWFVNNIALNKLDVGGNLLEVLPENSFKDMSKLSSLILSENNLREIHQNAFKGLTSLRLLDISRNRLTKLHQDTFVPFSGRIENNSAGRFGVMNIRLVTAFTGLWNLYLHTNNLTYFSDKMMDDLINTRSLNFFTFHSNPWQCACYLKIIKWVDSRNIRANSLGKGCYRKDNPVCIVPEKNPRECVEEVEEDIRSLYYDRYITPVYDFFDRNLACNSF